jgi:hypothetical protein
MLDLWLVLQVLEDEPYVVFQHGGMPPQIYNEVTSFLNRQLLEHWFGPSSLKFFLWALVKDKACILSIPVTLNNLKDQIQTATVNTCAALIAK